MMLSAILLATLVSAGTYQADCNTVVSGTKPSGSAPYVTCSFSDVRNSPGQVRVTITNNLPAGNCTNNFLFNINPLPSSLSASYQTGFKADGFTFGTQSGNLKAGNFNCGFKWTKDFCGGNSVSYILSGNNIKSSHFDSKNSAGYTTACDYKTGSSSGAIGYKDSCSNNPCDWGEQLVTYTPPAICQKTSNTCTSASCPGTIVCTATGCGGFTAGAACTNTDGSTNSQRVSNFQYCKAV